MKSRAVLLILALFFGAAAVEAQPQGSFAKIKTGTNTQATMTCGTGCTIATSGTGHLLCSTTAGITASTTQTQGQGVLTSELNQVSVVGNASDVVTLWAAAAGKRQTVMNDGANILQIFPESGDDLGNGVDASTELEPNAAVTFSAYDGTSWDVTAETDPPISTSMVVTNLAAANDDLPIPVRPGQKIELKSAACFCQGTCSTPAAISFEYRETGTASTVSAVTGSVTCAAYTVAYSPTTLSGNTTIEAGDILRFDVDNAVSPETDTYSIIINYRLF